MRKKIRFDIIIPVYNAEKSLSECIESVLNQTYNHFNLILVDDGSTDGSVHICDKYSTEDSRVKVIHKQNQGPLLARLEAIQITDSDYCIFLDSDDLLAPGFFEPLIEEIEIQDHDIFIYNYEFMSLDGTTIRKAESLFVDRFVFSQDSKLELYEAVVKTKLNSLCIKAIKVNLLHNDPTNYSDFAKVFFGEDLLLSLYPLTAAKSIKYLDLPLYRYRMSENSICRTFNPSKLKSILTVYKEMYNYFSVWDNKEKTLNQVYIKTYGKTLNNLFYSFLSQSEEFYMVKQIIQQIRLDDNIYIGYLNGKITQEPGLSRKQKIIELLFKYKQYFIIFAYFKMKRIISSIAGKTV